ncbi:ATP-dependent endonuclease [Peribacillus asahii]|uniref:ATP-dependent endonuclease n=1 Tax=Peribacillus asahii TaxID=228899 RepID=A0A3Q9RKS6_9BACI|nr:AAA family ATPase [Peribacillus asahii]AZV41530.1 ATP-dependent endonuclease [Peribacillus asahii]
MDKETIKYPFISRVIIKNFRNFKNVDVDLTNKQVILGENNIGKTNFIKALQLVLDPNLSDYDRYLEETDFNDTIETPFDNKEIIEISLEIQGFEHNTALLATFCDATINTNPPTIRITYEFAPISDKEYGYLIYLGEDKSFAFTHQHRKMLNLKVINGLRDANSDFKNLRKSPLNQLLKQYDFDKAVLKEIAQNMKDEGKSILSFEELIDLKEKINKNIIKIVGNQTSYSDISLETVDINPDKILNTLKLMIGSNKQRPTSEVSLGVTNILYISLVLLSLEDKTIPTLIIKEELEKLREIDSENLLDEFYEVQGERYYKLSQEKEISLELYKFFSNNYDSDKGHTILVIEEPEAHLHPILQRCIFRDVMRKPLSIILTTHSTDITSVSPINSIVHLRLEEDSTSIHSTNNINLNTKDKLDIERYMDVKRSELYFGKGVILVEGIAEEYLIPRLALNLGIDLDFYGIVCCNINSTNFKPYIALLRELGIPYIIFTDGDYYYEIEDNSSSKAKTKRIYHELEKDDHKNKGWLGLDLAYDALKELRIFNSDKDGSSEEDYNKEGYYFSHYTLEIDLMIVNAGDRVASESICNTFKELTIGGDQQKENFTNDFEAGDFYSCLRKIENSQNKVGKGRFAQRLSTYSHLLVPSYIENGLKSLISKITGD